MNKWEREDAVKIRVSNKIHSSLKKGIKSLQQAQIKDKLKLQNIEMFPGSFTCPSADGLLMLVMSGALSAINEGKAELLTREEKGTSENHWRSVFWFQVT